jgi:hypothetical protein
LIPYRAMLDVPVELLRYLTRLLAAERRRRGTPSRSRKLTCREQAKLALRWFRDRTRIEALGHDHGVSCPPCTAPPPSACRPWPTAATREREPASSSR